PARALALGRGGLVAGGFGQHQRHPGEWPAHPRSHGSENSAGRPAAAWRHGLRAARLSLLRLSLRSPRKTEALLIAVAVGAALLGFLLAALGEAVRQGQPLLAAAAPALLPPLIFAALFAGLHLALRARRA